MVDPTSGPASRGPNAHLAKVFTLIGATDLLIGVVLAVVGLSVDITAIVVAGLFFALSGTAVTSWMIIRANRPTQL